MNLQVHFSRQRNIDLITDGLWTVLLNTNGVPVKARKLKDWEKLKAFFLRRYAWGRLPQRGPSTCRQWQTFRLMTHQLSSAQPAHVVAEGITQLVCERMV